MPVPKIHSRICVSCGGPVKRPDAKRCRACYFAERSINQNCVDCGVKLEGGTHEKRRTRCWDCWSAFRKASVPEQCSREGCTQRHYAKGLCHSHYQVGHRRRWDDQVAQPKAHQWVKEQPCQLCGYARMLSHVHRPIPGARGGKYVAGNMVALCARCHEEVHKGLSECPPPVQIPEEIASIQRRTYRKEPHAYHV